MANGQWMVPFVALASMDREARNRARTPLALTMLPGGAAQTSAIAAVTVSQQATDSVRRERRVANQTVDAVEAAFEDPDGFDREQLAAHPALRPLATDAFVERIRELPMAIVSEAVEAILAARALGDNERLPAEARAAFPVLAAHLDDDQHAIVFNE